MTSGRFTFLGVVALGVALVAAAPVPAQGAPLEEGLYVENGGLVGVGTSNPLVRLHVNSDSSSVIRMENAGGVRLEFRDTANDVQWDFRTTSGNTFTIARLTPTPVNMMSVLANGDLRILGSLKTQNGTNTYPDDVFEPGYRLMPLSEVAAFIAAEGHLPGVTSRDEVRARGEIDVTELQLQLLRKVEELTLYTLAQQETIDTLTRRLAVLEGGEAAAPEVLAAKQ